MDNTTPVQSDQPALPANEVLERVMNRVAYVLTNEDLMLLEKLNEKDDEQGQKVEQFIRSRVPNFDAIMKEELDASSASQKTA